MSSVQIPPFPSIELSANQYKHMINVLITILKIKEQPILIQKYYVNYLKTRYLELLKIRQLTFLQGEMMYYLEAGKCIDLICTRLELHQHIYDDYRKLNPNIISMFADPLELFYKYLCFLKLDETDGEFIIFNFLP